MDNIGFDLDGTLSPIWWNDWIIENSNTFILGFLIKLYIIYKMERIKPLIIPNQPVHIISNRPLFLKPATKRWLKRNQIETLSINLRPVDNAFSETGRIKYKADKINELGLDMYFEDEPEIKYKLEILCPDTQIYFPSTALYKNKAATYV